MNSHEPLLTPDQWHTIAAFLSALGCLAAMAVISSHRR